MGWDTDETLYPLPLRFRRSPRTQVRRRLFSAAECDALIRHAGEGRFYRSTASRLSRQVDIRYLYPGDADWVYERLAQTFVNLNVWNFALTGIVEPFRVQRYMKGDFTREHADYEPDTSDRSKITAIVPLVQRSKWRGGRLMIGGIGAPRIDQGDCLLFPSFMFHNVLPVVEGVRIVLSGWVAGPSLV
jgi:predicted 2-oxoglutarate/Fe(II)-dependent dioxygenase YbiX